MVFKHLYAPKNLNKKESKCSFCNNSLYQKKCLISYAHTCFKTDGDTINIHLTGLCSDCVQYTQNNNNCSKYDNYLKENFNDLSHIFNYQKNKCIIIPNLKNEPLLRKINDIESILIGFIQPITYCNIKLHKIKKYDFLPAHDFLYEYGYIDPFNTTKQPKGYVKLSKINKEKVKCYVCGIKKNITQQGIIKICNNIRCHFRSRNYGYYEYHNQENKENIVKAK